MWSFPGYGFGIVRYYNEAGRFGFIQDSHARQEIFFHLNDGRMSVIDPLQDNVVFGTKPVSRVPRTGEFIIFQEGRNSKGPKAVQWVYSNQWAEIRDALPGIRLRKVRPGADESTRFLGETEHNHYWANACVLNASILKQNVPEMVPKFWPPYEGEDKHGPFSLIWECKPHLEIEYCSERFGWERCDDPRHESLR